MKVDGVEPFYMLLMLAALVIGFAIGCYMRTRYG